MLRVKNYNIKEMNIRSYSNNNTALTLTPIIVLGLKTF